MKQKFGFLICLYALLTISAFAQSARITAFKVDSEMGDGFPGKLFITVGGKQKKIDERAVDAWILNGGAEIVYSGPDGAGGFENEGQSLRIYDLKTGKARKIMSEYSFVLGVTETKTSGGATVLLVRMGDGGLGGSYFAAVDPKRGEIFYQRWAELTETKGDKITLAFYGEEKWDAVNDERGWDYVSKNALPAPTKVKPDKTESYDLKEILKNKVIYNKTNEERATEYERKYKDVVVYLWRPNDELPGKNYFLSAVMKTISRKDAVAPLRPTLELLFAGANENDTHHGFASSTFGMKFEGVVLKNGTATVKFSQPPNETNYGSLGPFIFLDAIEKTAKRFPTVKKVEVCAVGETMIDSELEEPFPRCAK